MSANLIVDLNGTVDARASLVIGSGSNFVVGEIVDLLHADTFTNVWVAGGVAGGSGVIEVRVQTSDALTSGTFTDPTSGLSQLPTNFVSGGVLFVNSGLWASGNTSISSPAASGPSFGSGGIAFGAFQRPGRYVRLINNSGGWAGALTAGVLAQKKTTGSGGGFSFAPSSGVVEV